MKDIRLDFRLRPKAGTGFVVSLEAEGQAAEADFQFDLQHERLTRVLGRIEDNHCSLDDLADVGISLWSGLMTGPVGELFESINRTWDLPGPPKAEDGARYQFRLALPPGLQHLPWETLYQQPGFGFVSSHPEHIVLRVPSEELACPATPPPADRLRILAVIPSGSGLDVQHERRNLKLAVTHVQDHVDLQFLAGAVTPDRLAQKLGEERWDIVHFIGHGEQLPNGRTVVRLNSDEPGQDEMKMDGEQFGALFTGRGVRLAVLNCCLGARPSPLRSMSGLGPFLLRAGVLAVVAMRYEVSDSVAIRFSDRFYRDLLSGETPGRVDLALERARGALFRNLTEDDARAFVTPVLLCVPGLSQLFERRRGAAPTVTAVAAAPAALSLPPDLVSAFKAGRCIPVVGQRVMTSAHARAGAGGLGPRQLALKLTQEFAYPATGDFDLCEVAGDWMDSLVLQRVCQRQLATRRNEFFKLTQAIQDTYRAVKPPALLSLITEWDVSGVFYLHFDGLLEEAFVELHRTFRPVYGVDRPVPPGGGTLLVHVRGAHHDAESLVLTEQDHDRLWDRLAAMTPEISELARGGRSLLFVGANPRDPLVKRLTRKLLERASPKSVGPIFFLCREGEKDDPYWCELSQEFPVSWIEGDLEVLVGSLTGLVRKS